MACSLLTSKKNKDLIIIALTILIISSFLSQNLFIKVDATSKLSHNTSEDFNNGTKERISIIETQDETKLTLSQYFSNIWTNKAPSNAPGPMLGHAMAPIYETGNVILFGGGLGSTEYSDTWLYNSTLNKWFKKNPPNHPSERIRHAMSEIYGTDNILFFGGGTSAADTWTYDLSENDWTHIVSLPAPGGRSRHAMANIYGTDKVLLFSGFNADDKTWIFDFSDNSWEDMNPLGLKPTSRYSHAMAPVFGTDKIVLFGGYDGTLQNDTWIYDYSDNKWKKMEQSYKPVYRRNHCMGMLYNTDKILLFGGSPENNNDEIWIYDLSENTWNLYGSSVKPEGRREFGMAHYYRKSEVLIFGGINSQSGYFDDTWKYEAFKFEINGNYISQSYDSSQEAVYKTLTWDGFESSKHDIKFQLRSAESEAALLDETFVGPEGKTSNFYTETPSNIWSGHYGDRWLQYKVYLLSSDEDSTPDITDISITYNLLPRINLAYPLKNSTITNNSRVFRWSVSDPDSSGQFAFQVLIDDSGTFDSVDFDSGEQDSINQFWNFPVGTINSKIPNGTWYWKVRVKDSDGDWGLYSEPWKLEIETKPPTTQIIKPQNNLFYNDLDTIFGSANNPNKDSKLSKVEISINRAEDNSYWDGSTWSSIETWLLTFGTASWNYDSTSVSWVSNNQYIIRSKAYDNKYNEEIEESGNIFTIDIEPPSSSITSISNFNWTNKIDNISGSAIDVGGAGINLVEISIKQTTDDTYWNGLNWISNEFWLTSKGAEMWAYNSSFVEWTKGATYQLTSKAADRAGNEEMIDSFFTARFDNEPPKNSSLAINDNFEYTSSTSVTLTLDSTDLESGVELMSFSNDGLNWSSWEAVSGSKIYKISDMDGLKTVYFRTQDKAGNIGDAVSDSVTLDTFDPHSLLIIINDGATETESRSVNLIVSAQDDFSGVHQMAFSTDRRTWTSWENYSVAKRFELPSGDGSKTIYFKVKDWAGNEARPVEASIKLQSPSFVESNMLGISSLIIVLIVVILIIIALLLKKRKQKELKEKSVTIKPDIQPQQIGMPGQYQQQQLYQQQQTLPSQPVFQQPQQTQVPMPMPYQYPQLPPGQQQATYQQQDRNKLQRY